MVELEVNELDLKHVVGKRSALIGLINNPSSVHFLH